MRYFEIEINFLPIHSVFIFAHFLVNCHSREMIDTKMIDPTHIPSIGSWILYHWTHREVPIFFEIYQAAFLSHASLNVIISLFKGSIQHIRGRLELL